MKTLSVSMTAFLIIALFGLPMVNSAIPAASIAAAVSPDQSNVAVQLTALQQSDGVRYSVTIINSEAQPLQGLSALVAVPAGANLVQALETDGYTHFLGALPTSQGLNLYWSANFAAGDYVDAFTFTLDGPVAGNIGVNLKWAGDQPGQIEFFGQPTVLAAGLAENDLTLGAAGTGDSLLPVGGTGMLVGVAPGQLPDGTKVHIRLMTPGENPSVTNDLWWCSAVEITGLPAGAEINVLVPLRQPLPPGAPVALFSKHSDGSWEPLAAEGIVTFDGQHVAYAHRGGAIATGIQNTFQPKLKLPKPVSPQPTTAPPNNRPQPTVGSQPTNVPPPPVRILPTAPRPIILTGTPIKIANSPPRSPTPQVIRPTKLLVPLVAATRLPATGIPPTQPPARATIVPPTLTVAARTTPLPVSLVPLIATATAATKSNVVTATPAAAASCKAPGAVCFFGGGSVISFCARTGVNCISTGQGGTICFTLTPGGRLQCAAPGGTVIFARGSLVPALQPFPTDTPAVKRSPTGPTQVFLLAPSSTPTPIVIIVTATFLPQPTVCVQSTGGLACTNQNGQLVPPPTVTPTPTVTPRADGGICFTEQFFLTISGISVAPAFGAQTVTLCVDVSGNECAQPVPAPFDPPFGCLAPGDVGYITPP